MKLTISDESVICYDDTIEFSGRCPKADFRVVIRFEDQDGNEWLIDRAFSAVPKRMTAQ